MYSPMRGISSTCDWTCRANSLSTFSRSARMGSKICESAGVVFGTVQRGTLSRPEQAVKVRGRASVHLRTFDAVQLRQGPDDVRDVGRLVALAAMRHRREKRTVGLGQQANDRDAPHG